MCIIQFPARPRQRIVFKCFSCLRPFTPTPQATEFCPACMSFHRMASSVVAHQLIDGRRK